MQRQGYNFLMTHDAQELLQKALTLPENERAELAGNLIASLDQTEDPNAGCPILARSLR